MIKSSKSERDSSRKNPERELIKKNLHVSRVAKVVKGGKNFSFAVIVVVGDGKGSVGIALGKAKEVPDAIKKATEAASRSMERFPLKEGRTLYQDVTASFGSARVHLRSAKKGTGIIAGGPLRSIFEAMGLKDVVAKALSSTNPHNITKATMKALRFIQTPKSVAAKRGLKVSDLITSKTQEMGS